MPTGPSLQVAPGWHPELQPRADHAECCSAPDQPGRQHHEGEAHLLRCATPHTGWDGLWALFSAPAGAHGCVYTYFTCSMQIGTWHRHMYTHLASRHSGMEAHVHLQTHTPPPAAISSRSCGSVSAPGVVGEGDMQGLGEESALKVHPAICLVHTGIPQMLISPPHPACCLLTFPD